MPDTTRYSLPYPDVTDPPNGPDQLQNLAEAVETTLGPIQDLLTTLSQFGVRKGSDTGRSSNTTTSADPTLKVTLPANKYYLLTSVIIYTGVSGADLKGGIYGPSGGFFRGLHWAAPLDASGTANLVNMNAVGFGNGYGFGTIGTGVEMTALLVGLVYSGAGGDVGFEWAQFTSNATATTLKSDSTLMCLPFPV
jgi:hypothetical protein